MRLSRCRMWNGGRCPHSLRRYKSHPFDVGKLPSAFFHITPGMWMNLQLDYEFVRAQREMGEPIIREVRPHPA